MPSLRHILHTILDFFFPPTPEDILDKSLSSERIKHEAPHEILDIPPIHTCTHSWAGFHYSSPLVRHALHGLKYRHNTFLAPVIAKALYDIWIEDFADTLVIDSIDELLILPIPLSKKRLQERGFNQSAEVVQAMTHLLSSSLPTLYEENILVRIKDIPSQTKHNREERFKNISGCFAVQDSTLITGKNILLIDDVITTGATMNEACLVLAQHNPRNIYCLAVAH